MYGLDQIIVTLAKSSNNKCYNNDHQQYIEGQKIFQQDGTPSPYAVVVREYLNETYPS